MPSTFLADPTAAAEARLRPSTSAVVYRRLLDAFGHPGRVVDLPQTSGTTPPALQVALALADVAVDIAVLEQEPSHWGAVVAAATDARIVPLAKASIVTALRPPTAQEIAMVQRGTAGQPSLGATLVVAVDGFTSGVLFALTGPGVDGVTHLHVTGLGEDMVAALMHSRTDYPAGVDLVLVAGRQLVGLPRSTQITRRHDTKGA